MAVMKGGSWQGSGISPAVKSLIPAYFYCLYRKENAEPKIFLAVSPPTNDIYLESLNVVKCNLTELTTKSASVILLASDVARCTCSWFPHALGVLCNTCSMFDCV